jgi:hypothetical protein
LQIATFVSSIPFIVSVFFIIRRIIKERNWDYRVIKILFRK